MQINEQLQSIRQSILVGTQKNNQFLYGASKRGVTLQIPSKEWLWEELVVKERSISISSKESTEVSDTPSKTCTLLDSSSNGKGRVRILARNSKRLLEERGYNLLRLCFGQVRWDTKEKSGCAPIIFIPVQLNIWAHRSKCTIVHTGEPIQINPAFWELVQEVSLRSNIKDFSVGEDISSYTPEAFFALLNKVQEESAFLGWSFEETCMVDVIEATHIQIAHDLAPNNWSAASFSQLRGVLGEGFVVDQIQQAIMEQNVHEQIRQSEEIPYILEADPAQSKAIVLAGLGGDFVIQGPPGTGKSQTIANIIALCVSQQKKVLFVAQKKAALDVVYQRLEEANLKHILLELHSSKSKRTKVMQSLKEAYQQKNIREQIDKDIQAVVRGFRESIEVQNALLQNPVGNTTQTLSDIFSSAHRTYEGISCVQHCPLALTWSEVDVQRLEDQSIELVERIQSQEYSWEDNPFRDTQVTTLHHGQSEHFFSECGELQKDIECLFSLLEEQEANIGCRFEPTFLGLHVLEQELILLSKAPDISMLNVHLIEHSDNIELLHELLAQGKSLHILHDRLLSFFQPSSLFLYKEISTNVQVMEKYTPKWWRVLLPKWWKAQRVMNACIHEDIEYSIGDLSVPVDELGAFHEKNIDFEMKSQWGGRFFRSSWEGLASDWDELYAKIQWYEESKSWRKRHPNVHRHALYKTTNIPDVAAMLASKIKACRNRIHARMMSLSDVIKPLDKHIIHYKETTNIHTLYAWISSPHTHRKALARAMAVQQACRPLYENELFDWIDWLQHCPQASHIRRTWKYSVYESRMQIILQQADAHSMTKTTLKSVREQYSKYDRQCFFQAQEQIARSHIQSICTLLPVGQMRVLTQEFARKRGGRTIRMLMQDCGVAIQRIKPVFMMSPMSVATNLPPEAINFDVVIFDEASQMTTPFALGALLRGKQAIVVGDEQQLSPSNFFTGKKETESILDRFLACGCPSIQLNFHYRSRHPSLISISNRFMYHNQLRPFPSPLTHPLSKGVRFVSSKGSVYGRGTTRCNPIEARMLVLEVIETIRRALGEGETPSIGIVAFSIAQRDMIQDRWDEEIALHPDVKSYVHAQSSIQQLFIKNLESVQGDERDIIFISIGYGFDKDHGFSQGFGPVTQAGGERRLNVLFSRARYEMVLFANFTPQQIQPTTMARKMLQEMLIFANRELEVHKPTQEVYTKGFVGDVCDFINSIGYVANPFYGPKGNTIDIVVAEKENPEQYFLAILCENGEWAKSISTRYQERQFPSILRAMDWVVYRIWSFPWYQNSLAEQAALKKILHEKKQERDPHAVFEFERVDHRRVECQGWTRRQKIQEEDMPKDIEFGFEPKDDPSKVRAFLIRVLDIEGPFSFDMLTRRISLLLQVRNAKKNKEAVSGLLGILLQKKSIYTNEGFYWTEKTPMELVLPNGMFREPNEIYPPHFRRLVHFYLSGSVTGSLRLEELSTLLLQQFGWKSISTQKMHDVQSVLQRVCVHTVIEIKDGVVYLI